MAVRLPSPKLTLVPGCIRLPGFGKALPLVALDLTQQQQLTDRAGGLLDAHDAGRQDLGIVYHQQVARL